jgi:hypothetical protein
MTSSASSATWLPVALARAAVVTARPAQGVPIPGRHSALNAPGLVVTIAAPEDVVRTGRHAEQEWARLVHDPERDEVDAFDWLGFTATQH